MRVIHENLASLGLEARSVVVRGSAPAHLARFAPDICFLDPPYDLDSEYAAALGVFGWMPPALVVAQHTVRLSLEETYGRLRRIRVLRQGDNAISFYEPAV